MGRLKKFKDFFTSEEKVRLTIDRLVAENYLSREKGDATKETLPEAIKKSEYILFNLAVHMACGAVFAFDLIPLPMGTISRDLWVIGNRFYYELRRDVEKKRVHSLPVLGISTIPWLGYFAYLLPLKKTSEDLTYVYANHVTYARKDVSLEKYLENKPRFVRKLVKGLFVPGYVKDRKI